MKVFLFNAIVCVVLSGIGIGSADLGYCKDVIDGTILNRGMTYKEDEIMIGVTSKCHYELIERTVECVALDKECFRIRLEGGRNKINIKSRSCGSNTIRCYFDKNSFHRYHFSISDVVGIWEEIRAREYDSIFEQPLLKFLKKLHDSYGVKVTLFLFYESEGFDLKDMPVKYRHEFVDNSGWLRLAFHARDGRSFPYVGSTYERAKKDYMDIKSEVERFAGRQSWSHVVRSGFCSGSQEAIRAWKDCGVHILLTCRPETGLYYMQKQRSWLGLVWALIKGAEGNAVFQYIFDNDYWIDFDEGVVFVTLDIVIEQDKSIVERLKEISGDKNRSEIIDIAAHEWPLQHKQNLERTERAIGWLSSKGYTPVFYDEGFLGSPCDKEIFHGWKD
jgi:hypothetical protein